MIRKTGLDQIQYQNVDIAEAPTEQPAASESRFGISSFQDSLQSANPNMFDMFNPSIYTNPWSDHGIIVVGGKTDPGSDHGIIVVGGKTDTEVTLGTGDAV